MSSPRWASRIPRRSPGRAVAAAGAPVGATLLALALPHHAAASAASLYMVGVVGAAVFGGRWSGVAAAILSFLGLNFFFTEPFHTLKVRHAEDLVALAVFLVVASVVAALVARVLQERDRAERSTSEARSLASFTGRLLSDEPIDRSLEAAARTLVQLFGLASCRIAAEVAGDRFDVLARGSGGVGTEDGDGAAVEVPLEIGPRAVGSLVVTRAAGRQPFTDAERASLRAFAGQVAMALQRTGYDAEIRRVRLEAEASDLRAALFSSITHDLRTPLASITASVSSLLDAEAVHDAGQREELLRTSLEEANRLNRLVGNLLDLARMRAGALRPASQLMPVEEVVEAVLGRLGPALKGVRVRTFIRDDLPLVSIDPIQIDQVLTNILENAIRFSPPGGELRVAVHRLASRVEVRVADDGPGIPREDRERVFEPFFKRDTRSGRGGTGLGLAIARAIVLAHDGRIWIEGTPAGGTAVAFQLPVPAQPSTALPPEPAGSERTTTEVP
ncbi:MAG: ATP-binding protein [Actinomycetota bacterium]|nr:ATP-binding protein [Actinomycetota bacterium]